jgi:predicted acetyltransferase
VRLDRQTVTALVLVVLSDPIEDTPCFQIGYAVPKAHRGQGRAKSALESAIAELKYGLARNKISTFYIEAVVGADNEASKNTAATTISNTPTEITDEFSGLPALHYVRKF